MIIRAIIITHLITIRREYMENNLLFNYDKEKIEKIGIYYIECSCLLLFIFIHTTYKF